MMIYRHFNGNHETFGTEEYFEQLAMDNWHNNVNKVQTRWDSFKDFRAAYFSRLLMVSDEGINPKIIRTLMDA